MGLLQKACLTYELHQELAGVTETGKDPLSPCSHSTIRAEICITVDRSGVLVHAETMDKGHPKIIIPVTEASANRTSSKVAPHPLCEQLRYLLPQNEAHYRAYTEQLKAWAGSPFAHPKLLPILTYVEGQTIGNDLLDRGLLTIKDGRLKEEKAIVCWRVVGLGEAQSGPCWTDPSLFHAFDSYYQEEKQQERSILCMVSGTNAPGTKYHMRGVVPLYGNAKLISSNDSSSFTYRGRFVDPSEAETVSYCASQKAHNALHWLIANQGVMCGGRAFVCWEPELLKAPDLFSSFEAFGFSAPEETPPAEETAPGTYAEYREDLKQTLSGWKTSLPNDRSQTVIAAFDAATSGRLAVTYYNELMASDFLDRLYEWDRTCCWFRGRLGIFSPSIWQLVRCAYGVQRKAKGSDKLQLVADDRILRQQAQRLVSCRIDLARMPADLVHRLVQRASAPQSYEWQNWENILFCACAAIRKYHYDQYKEEWTMALEPDKKDRSYQYGRLLAVLEKAERDTYSKEETREPNAIKMMSVFAQRPQYASRVVLQRVKTAYLPRLKKPAERVFYDKLIQEIYSNLSQFEERELNRPLSDTYLMGYYLQRKVLYTSHNDESIENNGGNES